MIICDVIFDFQEEIKHAVRGICNIMPKAVKIDCNKFVDEYGDVIINLLIEALSPADICTYIGLCTGEKIVPIQEQINGRINFILIYGIEFYFCRRSIGLCYLRSNIKRNYEYFK